MRVRQHFGAGEAAHFLLNRRVRLVEPAVAECQGLRVGRDQLCQACFIGVAGAARDNVRRRILEAAGVGGRNAKVRQADRFDLAHRDAAGNLGRVLADADVEDQLLDLAKPSASGQTLAPGFELPHGLDRGGEPGKSMRYVLRLVHSTHCGDLLCHGGFGHQQQAISRFDDGAMVELAF